MNDMSELSLEELAAAKRQDFATFFLLCFQTLHSGADFHDNWHIGFMARMLQDCQGGRILRLIINIAPRHLKSLLASVALPLFILGHNPSARIMCLSYGQDLADKLARDRLTIARSSWYQALFPGTRLSSERQAVSEFTTTAHGYCIATSIGGTVTGRGADFIIVDDPLKPEDALSDVLRKRVNDYYSNTLYSRFDDKTKGCMILIGQRLHQDDLFGHVTHMEPWTILSLPSIAQQDEVFEFDTLFGKQRVERKAGDILHPERESAEMLEHLRNMLGPYNFAGQYLQAPTPFGGGIVKDAWLLRYQPHETPTHFDQIVQSWDTATKASELSDYSVCTTWGIRDRHLYLLNVYRARLDYPDLKQAVRDQMRLFGATVVLIEDKSSGTQLIQELSRDGVHGIQPYKPELDKLMRMHAQTGTIQSGFVHIPVDAHWLPDYLDELTTFPASRFNDQVDSTSQALDWFKRLGDSSVDSVLAFYRQREQQQIPKTELVRVKAPPGITNFYVGRGPARTVDGRGTAFVSEDDATKLIANGWTVVEVHPHEFDSVGYRTFRRG